MTRTRAVLLYSFVAIAVAGVATLASLPASVLAGVVTSATNGQIRVTGASGTAWQGRGEVALALGGAPIVLPRVEWSVRPWRLFLGELAADVRTDGGDLAGRAQIALRPGGLFLRDADATLPARLVADRFVWLRGWNASGVLEAKGESFEVLQNGIVGAARLTWRDASAARVARLGTYQVDLDGDGRETRFKLVTLAGPLRLSGAGAFDAAGQIRVRGTATTDPANREQLAPILSLFGPPAPDGTTAFEWPLGGGGAGTPARSPGPAVPRKTGAATEALAPGAIRSAHMPRSAHIVSFIAAGASNPAGPDGRPVWRVAHG